MVLLSLLQTQQGTIWLLAVKTPSSEISTCLHWPWERPRESIKTCGRRWVWLAKVHPRSGQSPKGRAVPISGLGRGEGPAAALHRVELGGCQGTGVGVCGGAPSIAEGKASDPCGDRGAEAEDVPEQRSCPGGRWCSFPFPKETVLMNVSTICPWRNKPKVLGRALLVLGQWRTSYTCPRAPVEISVSRGAWPGVTSVLHENACCPSSVGHPRQHCCTRPGCLSRVSWENRQYVLCVKYPPANHTFCSLLPCVCWFSMTEKAFNGIV